MANFWGYNEVYILSYWPLICWKHQNTILQTKTNLTFSQAGTDSISCIEERSFIWYTPSNTSAAQISRYQKWSNNAWGVCVNVLASQGCDQGGNGLCPVLTLSSVCDVLGSCGGEWEDAWWSPPMQKKSSKHHGYAQEGGGDGLMQLAPFRALLSWGTDALLKATASSKHVLTLGIFWLNSRQHSEV